MSSGNEEIFFREQKTQDHLQVGLIRDERRYVLDTLLSWVYQIFSTGPNFADLNLYLHVISKYLGKSPLQFFMIMFSESMC